MRCPASVGSNPQQNIDEVVIVTIKQTISQLWHTWNLARTGNALVLAAQRGGCKFQGAMRKRGLGPMLWLAAFAAAVKNRRVVLGLTRAIIPAFTKVEACRSGRGHFARDPTATSPARASVGCRVDAAHRSATTALYPAYGLRTKHRSNSMQAGIS